MLTDWLEMREKEKSKWIPLEKKGFIAVVIFKLGLKGKLFTSWMVYPRKREWESFPQRGISTDREYHEYKQTDFNYG